MVVRTVAGVASAEDAEDLRHWLRRLVGGPPVDECVLLGCAQHGAEWPTWFYVEADAAAGVARRRCLACAAVVGVLDSAARWTYPPMLACRGCGQSIMELAVGLSTSDGGCVTWLVLGARCVECGRLAGLTDLVVDRLPLSQVLAGL